MIYPLLSKTDLLGVLCVNRTQNKTPFAEEDRQHADIFVSLVSQAIDNARLYRELETKIDHLKRAKERLSEMQSELIQSAKLAAVGKLAAGVAHEINNPLTSILGLLDLSLTNENQPKQILEDLKTMKEQALLCNKIVSNLLQFARKHPPQKRQVGVNEIVSKSLELMEHELRNNRVHLEKQLDPTDPFIEADPFQMQQVFVNLLRNAQDALEKEPNPQLTIRTATRQGKVVTSFQDNGCGISGKNLSKIFDPFFTTKEVGSGTGLGLSISYGIVKEHGGEINVKSVEGEGTTFSIELNLCHETVESNR
ncbi:MAG: GHKL domain-containing protein [Elusimicrobia bacterium]|nr:GHKL domain-containing protein [Elusimicrobiota bacterium]